MTYLSDLGVVVWEMRWHLLALFVIVAVVAKVVATLERRGD